jgi:ADP-heptose:LPS heptosyltransferase
MVMRWADSAACWFLSPRPAAGVLWRGLCRLSLLYVRLKLAISHRSGRRRPDAAPVSAICLLGARGEADNLHVPGMGDVICRNGVLKILSEKYPAARISLVAGPRFIERFRTLLLAHAYVHELIECPEIGQESIRSWLVFLGRMRGRRFDLCIVDPDSVTVRALHGFLCGMPRRIGIPAAAAESPFLTAVVPVRPTRGPVPDLLDITRGWADAIGVPAATDANDFTPRFPYRPDSRSRVDLPRPLVAVHVGGDKSWNRRWPLDHYTELCLKLCSDAGASVCLVGGTDDAAESACVHASVTRLDPGANIRNLTGRTLNDLANYLAQAALFIGNDSAPMHVAAAVGTPVIILSGPVHTYLWERMYEAQRIHAGFLCPLTDAAPRRHSVRQINCLAFRCPYEFDPEHPTYPTCMRAIPVDEVWNAAVARLPVRGLA